MKDLAESLRWIWIVPAMLSVAAVAPAETVRRVAFEEGRETTGWTFSNGPEFPGAEGSFDVQPGAGRGGGAAGELSFDFRGGGNYVQATMDIPAGADPVRCRFWVRKPDRNRLTLRGVDARGETFQKSVQFENRDWQRLDADLLHWEFSFGADRDGTVDRPIRQVGFIVDNSGGALTGAMWIDDVALVEGVSQGEETDVNDVDYTVAGFSGSSEQWHLVAEGDAAGSSWSGSELAYDFSGGASSVGVRSWALSIAGKPRSASLKVVAGEAGQHRVRVRLQSHFQTFERELGPLPAEGSAVFEIPLDPMTGWSHHGGENDGVVRLPLRLVEISIVRDPDGPERGAVRLEEVRARTQLPETEQIALIPRGRATGSGVDLEVDVIDLRPRTEPATVSIQAVDWDLRVLGTREQRIEGETPGRRETFRIAWDGLPQTYVGFDLTVRDGDGKERGRGGTCVVGLPEREGTAVLDPASPVGIGLYLYRWPGTEEGYASMTDLARLARRAGVKWSREEFNWGRIEPRRGERDWTFYDRLVEIAGGQGIRIYGLLCYWAPWAASYSPEGIEQYCDFVREAVGRYRGVIDHWEIWNEPNIFFWSGPREMYADLLAAAYRAVKEANPDAQVLGCSTAGIDQDFIRLVMDAGAPFDILTIHPYRGHLDDAVFIEDLRRVRRLVTTPEGRERPVWITEMGWPSQVGGVSERNQAALLARVYLGSMASRAVENVSWYDFREDGPDPFYNEHHFGVVRHGTHEPKPAYRALAVLTSMLDATSPPEEMPESGAGLAAYRFTKSGDPVFVIWSEGAGRVVRVSGIAAPVEIVNLMGERLAASPVDGIVDLGLEEGFPVYVTGPGAVGNVSVRELAVGIDVEPLPARPGQTLRLAVRTDPGLAVRSATWWAGGAGQLHIEPLPGGSFEGAAAALRLPETEAVNEVKVYALLQTATGPIRVGRAIPVLPETLRF